MLKFEEDYIFALDVVTRFGEMRPDLEGTIIPYTSPPSESNGLSIIMAGKSNDHYRINLSSKGLLYIGARLTEYCVRLSHLTPQTNYPTYHRFMPISRVDLHIDLDQRNLAIDTVVGAMISLLPLINIGDNDGTNQQQKV